MTWDEVIEIHAKALCNDPPDEPWMPHIWAHQRQALVSSARALATIRDAGVRLMPAEISVHMQIAGAEARQLLGAVCVNVYTAMLAVGEIKPEGA